MIASDGSASAHLHSGHSVMERTDAVQHPTMLLFARMQALPPCTTT